MIELKKNMPYDGSALGEYEKSQARAAAIIETLPYTELAPVQNLINYAIQQYETYDSARTEGWLTDQTKNLLKKALSTSLEQVKSNKKVLENGVATVGTSFDIYAKESLAQDSDLVENFKNENSDIKSEIAPAVCRVDAKYGLGAQYRDRTAFAVSLLGSGGAALMTKFAAAGVASTVLGEINIGASASRTAGVLRLLLGAGATGSIITQVHRACRGQDVEVTTKKSKSLKALSCNGDILVSQSKKDCILVGTLGAIGTYFSVSSAKKVLEQLRDDTAIASKAIAAANSDGSVGKIGSKLNSVDFNKNPQIELWRLAESGSPEEAAALSKKTQDDIQKLKVLSVKEIGTSSTANRLTASNPKLVTLENGMKGVWKPSVGHNINEGAEIAAYEVDRKLGLNIVPITVEKEVNGVKGSFQIFVHQADEVELKDSPVSLSFFDTLIRHNERYPDNYFTVNGRLVSIDHGKAFEKTSVRFYSALTKTMEPLKNQVEKVKAMEDEVDVTAQKFGRNSDNFRSAMNRLGPQIESAKKREKELLLVAKNSLATILPDKSVYFKLKSISASEWEATLRGHLPPEKISEFLAERNRMISKVDRLTKIVGDNVFRDGALSPLERESNVKIRDGIRATEIRIEDLSVDEFNKFFGSDSRPGTN